MCDDIFFWVCRKDMYNLVASYLFLPQKFSCFSIVTFVVVYSVSSTLSTLTVFAMQRPQNVSPQLLF